MTKAWGPAYSRHGPQLHGSQPVHTWFSFAEGIENLFCNCNVSGEVCRVGPISSEMDDQDLWYILSPFKIYHVCRRPTVLALVLLHKPRPKLSIVHTIDDVLDLSGQCNILIGMTD